MTTKEFQQIKDKAEQLNRQIAQNEGELKQLMKRLKQEFGCDNLEEAKAKLEQLKEQGQKLKARLDEKTEELEEKWGNYIDEQD